MMVAAAVALAVVAPTGQGTDGTRPGTDAVRAIEARAVPGEGARGRALPQPAPPLLIRAPAR